MPILASEPEKAKFAQVPAGTYQAVCYDVWDIGLQVNPYKDKNGNPQPPTLQIIIGFEVSELIKEGKYAGKRMTLNKFYNRTLNETATLRKHLESWRGAKLTPEELKGFDVESLIGANCMVSVIIGEKGKSQISSISKLMNNLPPMKPENERATPQWVVKYQDKQVSADKVDEIPF